MRHAMAINKDGTLRMGVPKKHALNLCLGCMFDGSCKIQDRIEKIPTAHPKVLEECPEFYPFQTFNYD